MLLLRLGVLEHVVAQLVQLLAEFVALGVEVLHGGEHLFGLSLFLETRLDFCIAVGGFRADRRVHDDLFGHLVAHKGGNELPEQVLPGSGRRPGDLFKQLLRFLVVLGQEVDDVAGAGLGHGISFRVGLLLLAMGHGADGLGRQRRMAMRCCRWPPIGLWGRVASALARRVLGTIRRPDIALTHARPAKPSVTGSVISMTGCHKASDA